jgi:hypothetical protein
MSAVLEGTARTGAPLPRMARNHEQELDAHLERFQGRLPRWGGRFVAWLRRPGSRWVRLPLGIVLILGGIVGFLPILGFWMVPLGLAVIALDLPLLQPVLVRFLDWLERKLASK